MQLDFVEPAPSMLSLPSTPAPDDGAVHKTPPPRSLVLAEELLNSSNEHVEVLRLFPMFGRVLFTRRAARATHLAAATVASLAQLTADQSPTECGWFGKSNLEKVCTLHLQLDCAMVVRRFFGVISSRGDVCPRVR